MATPSKPTGPTHPNPGPNPNLGQSLGPTPPTTPGAFPLGPNPPKKGAGSDHDVSITDKGFDPKKLTVKVGDTVTWTNNAKSAHGVAFDGLPTLTTDIQPGATYTHTVTAAGDHHYHCPNHPELTGEIVAS